MSAHHVAHFGKNLQAVCPAGGFVEESRPDDKLRIDRTYGFVRKRDLRTLASYTAQTMPGCCGAILLYHFTGEPDHVANFIKVGLKAAQKAGYGLAVLTLRATSGIIPRLESFSLGAVTFTNGKTGNDVVHLSFVLPQNKKKPDDTEGE